MVNDNMLRALICNKLKGREQELMYPNPTYLSRKIYDFLADMKGMFGTKESKLQVRNRMQNPTWQKGERFEVFATTKT